MRVVLSLLLCLLVLPAARAIEQSPDCIKLRACDAIRPCEVQEDKTDCEPSWPCGGWGKFFCEIDKARKKTSCEAAKAAQNAGYAAAKGSCEVAKAAEKLDCERLKSLNHLGCAVAAITDPVGEGINHFGKEVSNEFCDLMTGGGYKRGDAGCGVDAGVGRDSKGYYTYDTKNPDTKYRGPAKGDVKSQTPEEKRVVDQLNDLARRMNRSVPETYSEFNFKKAYGIDKFLLGKMRIGTPWPATAGPLFAPTRSGLIRGRDREGGGSFLSTRRSKEGIRFHVGEDYVAMPRERIFSTISGDVVRLKPPGKQGLSGLEIRAANGYTLTIYYIAASQNIQRALQVPEAKRTPSDKAALKVIAGSSTLGFAQDLTLPNRYGSNITNHVHVTLQDDKGQFISLSDPKLVITAKPTKSK